MILQLDVLHFTFFVDQAIEPKHSLAKEPK